MSSVHFTIDLHLCRSTLSPSLSLYLLATGHVQSRQRPGMHVDKEKHKLPFDYINFDPIGEAFAFVQLTAANRFNPKQTKLDQSRPSVCLAASVYNRLTSTKVHSSQSTPDYVVCSKIKAHSHKNN